MDWSFESAKLLAKLMKINLIIISCTPEEYILVPIILHPSGEKIDKTHYIFLKSGEETIGNGLLPDVPEGQQILHNHYTIAEPIEPAAAVRPTREPAAAIPKREPAPRKKLGTPEVSYIRDHFIKNFRLSANDLEECCLLRSLDNSAFLKLRDVAKEDFVENFKESFENLIKTINKDPSIVGLMHQILQKILSSEIIKNKIPIYFGVKGSQLLLEDENGNLCCNDTQGSFY
jgi:hypothetical protein